MTKKKLMKIGQLASQTSLPVKTIRYYSEIGLVPPTERTEAGFRLYSESDQARLELIRALRDADLDLATIRQLLSDKISASRALGLQLELIENKVRCLQRQRTLIQAALSEGESGSLAYLKRARALAHLDAAGRKQLLRTHLAKLLDGVDGHPDWQSHFLAEVSLDLPEKIDRRQFRAWLELTDLLLDQRFMRFMNDAVKDYWRHSRDGYDVDTWRSVQNSIFAEARTAASKGSAVASERCQQLVSHYVDANAVFMRQKHDSHFEAHLLSQRKAMTDPRLAQFWNLIGTMRAQPKSSMWSPYQAHIWLVKGLAWKLSNTYMGSPCDDDSAERSL